MRTLLFILAISMTSSALAHIGAPVVKNIRFPDNRAEPYLLVIDNVGLLSPNEDGLTWLCDEAITIAPGFNDLIPMGDDGQTWIAATRQGLFRSIDDGCHFDPVEGILTQHVASVLLPHPTRRNEALAVTQTLGIPNDVFRTQNEGETWSPANLELGGRVRSILRSVADPEQIYLIHAEGALRSTDGGSNFEPMALAPMGVAANGTDIDLLAIHPHNPREIWSVLVQFPESLLLRSIDGGDSWTTVAGLEDVPESMIFSQSGTELLLSMPFAGLLKSTDSGETWTPLPLPEPGLWLSCLSRSPSGDVYSCVRRGDWLVLRSPDFGETWSVISRTDFSDITARWSCPDESLTIQRCAEACDRTIRSCTEEEVDAGPMEFADGGIEPRAPDTTESSCQIGHRNSKAWPIFMFCLLVFLRRLRPF